MAERAPEPTEAVHSPPATVATGLAKIGLVLRHHAWQERQQSGLTPTQGQILALLRARGEQLTVGELAAGLGKDPQVVATAMARRYRVDRLIRVSPPRPLTTPKDGPLLAVRLSVLTRKTLGGLWTDTSARVLRQDGSVLPGLWAAGEAAGFGGGGVHGHRALEGTFLGGCLYSGRVAGRSLAAELG